MTTDFAKNLLNSLANNITANQREGILNKPIGQVLSAVDNVSTGTQLQQALGQFIGSTQSDTQHLDALKALSGPLSKRDGEDTKPVYMAAVAVVLYTLWCQLF